MHLFSLFFLLACFIRLGARGEPAEAEIYTPQDARHIYSMLEQGQQYRQSLEEEKMRLYDSIKAYDSEHSADLYRLAAVKYDDFSAFERLVFGMLREYMQVVQQHERRSTYDFRTPALKLTFEFQLAIKKFHEQLTSNTIELGESESHETESVGDVLTDMLKEIRENADQLEQGMRKHNIVFSSDSLGQIETVLKVGDDGGTTSPSDDHWVTLIDQDNNEYVMTRPSDTTIIYEDMQLLHDLILIVVVSFVFGSLFSWVGFPAFFGYILAGILAGPSGTNLIKELIQTETLAQLGVVLIVFVLGLEFSLEKIKAMWQMALGGAMMILLVTMVFFVMIGVALGATVKEAIFVGACVSLSSTAVVVKVIKSDHLEHLYSLLVMQDVLLGFMLAMIPALAKSGIQVLLAMMKITLSLSIFALICFAIVRLLSWVPRMLRRLSPKPSIQPNSELMLLGTIAICMVMLVISENLGLGMELGCFAAGVIVRSRKSMFEVSLALIEPVRDLFGCLFFASIGLHIYPSFLASEAMLLLTMTAAVIGFKYMVTSIILVFFKFDIRKSSTMAIALAQISEFAFVLASRAKQMGIITREVYYLLLAVTSLTLMATPILWKLTDRASFMSSSSTSSSTGPTTHHHHSSSDHHHHQLPVAMSLDDADKFA